ncbi:GNAT family N-acetyltransferase [Nocardia arizonensis]|uniref:GNAT family N-acetyltransferase n=1 Tax=Nocardia arizonensis TaxID=1141647 RepID=UPI0006D29228|nr:GNAT family N-acetyltransferase [Nocardia arizonensis]
MRIAITDDIAEFGRRAEPLLRRDPLRHTVLATLIANYQSAPDNPVDSSQLLTVHAGDDSVHGVVSRLAGRDIYVSALPEDAVDDVVRALAAGTPRPGGVEGASDIAPVFASRWGALCGVGYRRAFVNRLYRLDALNVPAVAGSPRRATEADTALCARWAHAMRVDAGIGGPGWDAVTVRRRIAAGRWWLWERDGRPVSLAAHQIPAHGWVRIGPVYTPPAERGHGYASAVTAHVAHSLRTRGLGVCLFADVDNPTSNKIYRALGFRPAGEYPHYSFG